MEVMLVKISVTRKSETLLYAAEELKKYLLLIDGACAEITDGEGDVRLGLLSELGLSTEGVFDPMIDDVIDVSVDGLSGYISGSNERSVLMGVYTFLKSLGCMWVRPGKDGEYIPKKDTGSHSFTYRKRADYGFRGECIEGGVSYEHVLDTVDWLPKVNLNFFMLEQLVPYNYFSRWYDHSYNTLREDEKLSYEDAERFVYLLEGEIKKRGLQLHSLGHGYFYEPYGIHFKTNKFEYTVSEKARSTMALLGGKRGLSHNSPFHTQMCLSNAEARRDHVLWLADYIEKKPYIDFLHVWLGDGANNQCECDACREKTVSDWYIEFLNEIDREFTLRGFDTKIVFIMYNDTMWAPLYAKLNDPSRFLMTVTIQARDHGVVFSPERYKGNIAPWKRNNINYNNNTAMMLALHDRWKPFFDGRSFIFEYRLYTDHYVDPSYMDVSRIMYEDCVVLSELGFDGILTDKTQRSYFPTALPMALMGETLFDKKLDYEGYLKSYFESAYGKEAEKAREYLSSVMSCLPPREIREVVDVTYEDTGMGVSTKRGGVRGRRDLIPTFRKVYPLADKFKEVCLEGAESEDHCHRKSWDLLLWHTEFVKLYADFLTELARDDIQRAEKKYDALCDYLSHMEEKYSLEFDLQLFARKLKSMMK